MLSGCGVVVLGLELNGRDKADLAVKAAVIEPQDAGRARRQRRRPQAWTGGCDA